MQFHGVCMCNNEGLGHPFMRLRRLIASCPREIRNLIRFAAYIFASSATYTRASRPSITFLSLIASLLLNASFSRATIREAQTQR